MHCTISTSPWRHEALARMAAATPPADDPDAKREGIRMSNAYGILIAGDAMEPAFRAGDTAWVDSRLPVVRDCEVVLYRSDPSSGGELAAVRTLIDYTDDEWIVGQFNPPGRLTLDRRVWTKCHRITGKTSRP